MTVTEASSPPEAEFVITRTFGAPRPLVWDAWTKPELLARWFGPKGATTTIITQDRRPGGMLHGRMINPGGMAMWFRFVYRELVEPSRLVWVQSFADEEGEVVASPFGGPWPLELLTTVTFEDDGRGTRVKVVWVPINASAAERAAFADNMASMNAGWSGSLDVLDALLAGAGH